MLQAGQASIADNKYSDLIACFNPIFSGDDKESLKDAPGFDKDKWPNMADPTWTERIHSYYGTKPYSENNRGIRH